MNRSSSRNSNSSEMIRMPSFSSPPSPETRPKRDLLAQANTFLFRRRRCCLRMSYTTALLLLMFPALFSLLLIFQGPEKDYRIRLTPAGRLACTSEEGCSLPRADSLNFLVVGDIGGLPIYPYYSYAQTKVSRAMVHAARRHPPQFVLNVGDNFYFNGVDSIFDSRFEDSFEQIYDHPELLVPWYTIAGNHDHLGNISAQLAHTNFSNKWTFPDLFYKVRISFGGNASAPNSNDPQRPTVLELLMLDTIVLCGNTVDMQGQQSLLNWLFAKKKEPVGPDPEYRELAKKQWEWIERELAGSDADYLLVAGHYPIYSTCEHGGFACLKRLDSLLHLHGANAYFSGHDHNLQHIRMARQKQGEVENVREEVEYIVCGAASRSDRSAKHLDDVPKEALLFRYPTGWNPFSQIGFSNGGFVQASLGRDSGVLHFINGKQESKYTLEMRPRRRKTGRKTPESDSLERVEEKGEN